MNRAAHEAGDMVKLIELEGEEKLFYPAFPIDIAVIRATYADERGNCTFEREGVYAEALAHANRLAAEKGYTFIHPFKGDTQRNGNSSDSMNCYTQCTETAKNAVHKIVKSIFLCYNVRACLEIRKL